MARQRVVSKKSAPAKATARKIISTVGTGGHAVPFAMDTFTNPAARIGAGTNSLGQGSDYVLERWSNDYFLMITLYRNQWLARRIVEKPAQDMCRAWPQLKTEELDPTQIKHFDRVINRTYTPRSTQLGVKWGRLFGGGANLIVIDGHEDILDQPLDLDDVALGSYKGLITFDRWSGITPSGNPSNDINSPIDWGLPEYYKVQGIQGGSFLIHHSRVLRHLGPDVPQPENQAAMNWGISELEVTMDETRKRDNMSWSVLNLMFRAQILTQVNPQLAQLMSGATGANAAAQQNYQRVMEAQNELLSNQSMLILPEDGKLESHSYSFAGISEMYEQFRMDVSGAARIPVAILFGRTATGLGQTSDADMRIYEQEIGQKQHNELEPNLHKLYPVICMSEFGFVPDDMDVMFPSARILTEEEKAVLAKDGGAYIAQMYEAGIWTQKIAMTESKTLADTVGIGHSIQPEDIEKANNDVQLAIENEQAVIEQGDQDATDEPGTQQPKGGSAKD
jgi:phage-related protein (TIGR01555 family)